jgi:hypothetical protein
LAKTRGLYFRLEVLQLAILGDWPQTLRRKDRLMAEAEVNSPGKPHTPGQRPMRLPWLRALGQTAAEVAVRNPGSRYLSAPKPARHFALEDWQFAWLAASAYDKTKAGARRRPNTSTAEAQVDPESALREAGWKKWDGFPNDGLHRQIEETHLRVEVWQKTRRDGRPVVAVAFGGTVINNKMDWRANLRWFLPGGRRDQYTAVVRSFAPAFVHEFTQRLADYLPRSVVLIATGYSLGGGLAQQFAYAHCVTDRVPRVTKVYAFDPLPVTGFFSVKRSVRNINRRELQIDRIYERGEILALVRSIMSVLWKPSARAPQIRGRRYFLFRAWNPIVGHSMVRMAERLSAAAGHPRRRSPSPDTPVE